MMDLPAPDATAGIDRSIDSDDDLRDAPVSLDEASEEAGTAGNLGTGGAGNGSDLGGAAGSVTGNASGGITGAGGAVGTGGIPGTDGGVDAEGVVDAGGVMDTADVPGTDGVFGTGDAVGTDSSVGAVLVKLTGTLFGTGPPYNNDPAYGFAKVFDGNINTWDDDQTASNGYAGIDLGAPASVSIIRYYPRSKWNTRMVGGKFQCSISSQTTGFTDLFTIANQPPLAWTEVTLTSSATCRYLRYLGPTSGKTNVAEVEFWGSILGSGPGPTDAGAPLTNLSFNRPVMASSERLDSQQPKAGNDGLLTTKFCSADGALPVWWMVDLGAIYPLIQTDINSDNPASAYQYMIEVSSDAGTWDVAVDRTFCTNCTGGTLTDDFHAQGRYVRLTITNVLTTGGPGCFLEFLVWGYNTPTDSGTQLANLSLGMPTTASSPQSANKPPSNGNDGNTATPFCSANGVYPVWWEVDLGAVHSMAMTEISLERQTVKYKYIIEVSSDNSLWSKVVDRSLNTTRYGAVIIDPFSASGRYVRITMLGSSTGDWGCFFEFTVWGYQNE